MVSEKGIPEVQARTRSSSTEGDTDCLAVSSRPGEVLLPEWCKTINSNIYYCESNVFNAKLCEK